MTIKFVTKTGKRVETQNVDILFEAARSGEITPSTVVEVNGRPVWAGKIKNLFPPGTEVPAGEPPALPPAPADALPESIKTAFKILYVFLYISAVCGILYALFVAAVVPPVGIGIAVSSIIWSVGSYQFLRVLEYIATKISE